MGDPCLNRHAVLLAERLGQKPGASIPGACENWAATAAAYRFLRNEQVSCEEVMAAHRQATMGRIREHAVVLCLQDTTELDYNGQAMTGLGPLGYEAQRGLYLHPTYVVAPERESLGVMNARTWAREFKQGDAPRGGVLESVRWVESYERIAEQASELPGTRHVCIGDRESDILALLVMARKMSHAADYLVRLTSTPGAITKAWRAASKKAKRFSELMVSPASWWRRASARTSTCTSGICCGCPPISMRTVGCSTKLSRGSAENTALTIWFMNTPSRRMSGCDQATDSAGKLASTRQMSSR